MKTFKIKIAAILLLVFSIIGAETISSEIVKTSQDFLTEKTHNFKIKSDYLDKKMQEFVDENNIPNAVISLVCADQIHLLKGYGYADVGKQVPVNPEKHLFRTGSVSKIFVWVAVLQLYEQGLVDMHTDINEYLDIEFEHKVLYKTPKPEPITLYHLITHTAGFEDVLEGLFSFKPLPSLEQQLLRKVPARIFPPGEIMAYSNWGTSLAGYIVEKVSGLSFEEYVKQNIFLKSGMSRSSFEQPLPDNLNPYMVNAYRWIDGEFYKGSFEHMAAPAGGISTTAYDMALFLQAYLNGGSNIYGTVLQPQNIEKMLNPGFRYHPKLSGMTYGMIESDLNGQRIVAHGGSSTIFDSGFYVFPELSKGIFIAYSGGDYTGHIRILQEYMDEFFPFSEHLDKNIHPLVPATISDLKGEYHQSRRMITSSDRMLNLIMGSLRLKPLNDNQIKFTLYGTNFEYEKISEGVYKTINPNSSYPFGSMDYILTSKSPEGRLMLVTDGPMTFIKAKWYETTSFALIIFIPAILLAVSGLVFFMIRLIYRKVRKKSKPFKKSISIVNKVICTHAIFFVLALVLFMLNVVPHPVHLLPKSFFTPNPLLETIISIGFLITGIIGVVVAAMSIRLWVKEPEFKLVKLYHSIYALFAFALIWLFSFYNFIGF